ncbi:hypothetical protein NC652_033151 [Populus alba x Populus x berolinensis]|nr:hypothetical protein NC652_033151 [Populus alba x Populus x berolinensis]
MMQKKRNFRKRTFEEDEHNKASDDDEQERRLALEEVKFLQKQRERKSGIPALATTSQTATTVAAKLTEKTDGDGEKEELVLQDTFAQETAVMVEDPNMLQYVEQELAKKRGKNIDAADQVETELKRAEDELYKIPEHLKVKKRNSEESSTQWTTGIAEVQLPIEYKLRNIEETEAAKKLLQEKRLMGRPKSEFSIPSSYSADYFQRGRDYAEKLRRGCWLFLIILHPFIIYVDWFFTSPHLFTKIKIQVLQVLNVWAVYIPIFLTTFSKNMLAPSFDALE